jgi:UDP-N-acetylmuramoyl-tripeptide--D-alanyl-D-alanine ligase
MDEIVRGLGTGFRAPHRTHLMHAGSWRILDDSYNASPDSMAAALELLATLPGRHVAVLGEMLELGDRTDESHREVGRRAAQLADRLLVVGVGARLIGEEAIEAGMPAEAVEFAPDRDAAVKGLEGSLQPNDTILVKASRGPALDLLVDALVELGGSQDRGVASASAGLQPAGDGGTQTTSARSSGRRPTAEQDS